MGTTTNELEGTQASAENPIIHIGAVIPNLRSNYLSRLLNAAVLQAEQHNCRISVALHNKDPKEEPSPDSQHGR